MPKAAQSRKSCVETDSGCANQKQAIEHSHAERPIAGSIGTSRCLRMMVLKPAMPSVISTAKNWPSRLPPILAPHSITPTPKSATVLPMSVDRDGFSPTTT